MMGTTKVQQNCPEAGPGSRKAKEWQGHLQRGHCGNCVVMRQEFPAKYSGEGHLA